MSEEALVGVVSPLANYRQDEARPFEDAHSSAVRALAETQSRLASLREQRAAINAEIKQLVTDEDLLSRMTRVHKPGKSG
jgi:hypothetical protein